MKREIKFRAFDGVDYITKPFTLLDVQNGKIQLASSDTIVMQYTGLKDTNGKEIYEGDIYKTWYSRDTSGKDIIHLTDVVELEDNTSGRIGYDILFFENAEVIGNIYQNPELLNK